MLVGGCEDGYVRVFDLNTHKIVKKMPAKKSVGCVMGWDWNIISGDHSGCISSWDARMFRLTEQK